MEPQIRQRLLRSMELGLTWKKLLIACLSVTVAFIYMVLRQHHEPGDPFWIIGAWTAAAVIVPVFLGCILRTAWVMRCPEQYIFCSAVLDQPHVTLWQHRCVYYTVCLEDPVYGYKYTANTRAIFQRRGFIGPLADAYTNRTVTVAYNRKTETVVVIG